MKRLLIAIALATTGHVYGQTGSAELMSGHQSSTLDTKIKIGLTEHLSFFNRNRVTSDYEGKVSTFHMAKFSYQPGKHFGITGGMMGSDAAGTKPQLGIEYAIKNDDVSAYQLLICSTEPSPTVMSLTNIAYTPRLKENLDLFLELENVSFLNKESNVISLQRPRIGIDYKGFQAGLAADISETGKRETFDYNIGCFVKKRF